MKTTPTSATAWQISRPLVDADNVNYVPKSTIASPPTNHDHQPLGL